MRKLLGAIIAGLTGSIVVGEENLPWVDWTWTPPVVSVGTGKNEEPVDCRWFTSESDFGVTLNTRPPTGCIIIFR